jgi:hypothetical protein
VGCIDIIASGMQAASRETNWSANATSLYLPAVHILTYCQELDVYIAVKINQKPKAATCTASHTKLATVCQRNATTRVAHGPRTEGRGAKGKYCEFNDSKPFHLELRNQLFRAPNNWFRSERLFAQPVPAVKIGDGYLPMLEHNC